MRGVKCCRMMMDFYFEFVIRYYNKFVIVTYVNLENEVVDDLRNFVFEYFELGGKEYKFLDLGRIMDGNEKLVELTRNSFTLYIRD